MAVSNQGQAVQQNFELLATQFFFYFSQHTSCFGLKIPSLGHSYEYIKGGAYAKSSCIQYFVCLYVHFGVCTSSDTLKIWVVALKMFKIPLM
jgi:hypothetical protein